MGVMAIVGLKVSLCLIFDLPKEKIKIDVVVPCIMGQIVRPHRLKGSLHTKPRLMVALLLFIS